MEFSGIHLTRIFQEAFKISIHEMILKTKLSEWLPHLPGANELISTSYKSIKSLALMNQRPQW